MTQKKDGKLEVEYKDDVENYSLYFTDNNHFHEYVMRRMKTTEKFYNTSVKPLLNIDKYYTGKLYDIEKYNGYKVSADISSQLLMLYYIVSKNRGTTRIYDGNALFLMVGFRNKLIVYYKENNELLAVGDKKKIKLDNYMNISDKIKEEFNNLLGEIKW